MLQKHLQNIRKKPNTFDLLLFFSVSTTYNKDGFRLYDELKRANDDNATDMVRSINYLVSRNRYVVNQPAYLMYLE